MERAVPRPDVRVAPRVGPSVVAPRYYGSRSYGSRGYVYPRYSNRSYGYRGDGYRGDGYRGYGYRGYGYRGRVIVPVVPYYRPYYAFRPHFSIGFGLFVGYPVPYPYYFGAPSYVYPYPAYPAYPPYSQPYGYDPNYDPNYPSSAPYGAPPEYGTSVGPPPAQGTYGGISFEITPDDAAIYVDGAYVGVVRDFSPTHQPLTLTPGAHHIELQAQGCAPLTFDATIASGEVIPYRGALQPY